MESTLPHPHFLPEMVRKLAALSLSCITALAMRHRNLIEMVPRWKTFCQKMPRKFFNIKLLSIFELKNVQKSRKAWLVS